MDNRNEDLIELYRCGTECDIEPNSSNIHYYPRSRSSSLRPRSMSIQRETNSTFIPLAEDHSGGGSIRFEEHTAEIIRNMEEDDSLMEDNPISEHMRM